MEESVTLGPGVGVRPGGMLGLRSTWPFYGRTMK